MKKKTQKKTQKKQSKPKIEKKPKAPRTNIKIDLSEIGTLLTGGSVTFVTRDEEENETLVSVRLNEDDAGLLLEEQFDHISEFVAFDMDNQ